MSTSNRSLLTLTALGASLALALTPALLSTGCAPLECAEGTIEQNGECVPADSDPGSANCGEGTVLGDDGTCVSELPPTICGENTIEDTESVPGMTVCVGSGGPTNCATNLPCPSAGVGKISVCGRIYDVETDAPIQAAAPTFLACDEVGAAQDGPCALQVDFYDAIAFAGNPTGATPQAFEEFRLDDCGRFVARNVNMPTSAGFLGIGVDDVSNPGEKELTGIVLAVASQQVKNGTKAYVMKSTTNADWSADVGFGAGNSFHEQGVYMAVFMKTATPVAGVTVTGVNGAARPADDYYFADTAPFTRSMVIPTGPTGPNGSALLLGSGLVDHSGTGGEPTTGSPPVDCVWPENLAASIPGLLFFQPRIAEVNANTACP